MIKGWDMGIKMMKKGENVVFIIFFELVYGEIGLLFIIFLNVIF